MSTVPQIFNTHCVISLRHESKHNDGCRSQTIVENYDLPQRSNKSIIMCLSYQPDISLLRSKRAKWKYLPRPTKGDVWSVPNHRINLNVLWIKWVFSLHSYTMGIAEYNKIRPLFVGCHKHHTIYPARSDLGIFQIQYLNNVKKALSEKDVSLNHY